jgi:RNA polymerase sigma factor (sigma-70 family)
MQDIPDCELLRRFVQSESEEAFTELVRRHINLVYSVALRHTENAHDAQEITQAVFTMLARKAASLGRETVLSGWLYHTARLTAANFRRAEIRHVRREQEAYMQSTLEESSPDTIWRELAPLLDEAMAHLDATDRDAVVLRYFEKQDLRAVGSALGISEDAAQKHVSRAVERLREFFAKRGVTIGASGLAVAITANAVQAAPIGLVATISTAALVGTVTVATIATHTTVNWINIKSIAAIVAAVIAAGTGTHLVQKREANRLRSENQSLIVQVQQLSNERDKATHQLAAARDENERLNRNTGELLKLRGEVGMLRRQATHARSAEEENAQLRPALAKAQSTADQLAFKQLEENIVNDMKQLGLGIKLYAGDHNGVLATNFDQFISELSVKTNASGSAIFFHSGNELANFEFMNVGLVKETMPDKLIFRERTPRRTPDGKWTRVYGFADGSVVTQISDDGNFDVWEKQHLVQPPTGP